MRAKFPDPITLPPNVFKERDNRLKQIVSSSIKGVILRAAIIIFELVGVYIFGSAALLMDALSSLFDVASTIFLIICLKLAAKPPDEDHPFGHGRYEPLVGLLMGLVLFCFGLGLILNQFMHLAKTSAQTPIHGLAWVFPLVAVILLEICYQNLKKTAEKQHSAALMADAIHYRVDSLTSLFAMVALLLGSFLPSWSHLLDTVGALTIAFFMVGMGFFAARGNFHQLMDRVPPAAFFLTVRQAALKVKGVKETEKTKIQLYGPDAHVDIDIEVDPDLSVEKAHKISQEVRAEIQKAWPSVRDVIVHIEPYYPNDHT